MKFVYRKNTVIEGKIIDETAFAYLVEFVDGDCIDSITLEKGVTVIVEDQFNLETIEVKNWNPSKSTGWVYRTKTMIYVIRKNGDKMVTVDKIHRENNAGCRYFDVRIADLKGGAPLPKMVKEFIRGL